MMEFSLIENALRQGNVESALFRGSSNTKMVTELQRILFELGFKRELKWDNFQADGDYGPATTNAVASFAQKNNVQSDGSKVTKKLAELMLNRHSFLFSMYVLWSIHKSDLRKRKFISKGTNVSVAAVQTLLNELGYGRILKFAQFGADGQYGPSTRKAVIAYARDNGIDSDGDLLKRPLINQMIKDINKFYGRDWSLLADNFLPSSNSPLIFYDGSRFMGKPCLTDREFLPSLEKINRFAEQSDIFIFVTSSFRTTTNVNGAIVRPAVRSNHLAGHGIDMNVIHSNGQWANSGVLEKFPNVPGPVRNFIRLIKEDPVLRWGGDFQEKDPVHIDDGLNQNLSAWEVRYKAMQTAVQLGQTVDS